MAKEWVIVRVSRETHKRLEEAQMRLAISRRGKGIGSKGLWINHVSLDQVIAEMLSRDEKHLERARKAGARRRAGPEPELHQGEPLEVKN